MYFEEKEEDAVREKWGLAFNTILIIVDFFFTNVSKVKEGIIDLFMNLFA